MMKKFLLFFTFILLSYGVALAQTGKLTGKVKNATTGEALPFATVVAKLNGEQRGLGQTDLDGSYTISPLVPGTYSVEVQYAGYTTKIFNGIIISVDKTSFLDIPMSEKTNELAGVDVIDYKVPIIDKDNTTQGQVFTGEQIRTMAANRSINTIAAQTAAVVSSDDGAALNIMGNRSSGTQYIVNGVKQIGAVPNLPPSAIAQMTVLTGGIPAQYGDAVGGIINITTSSPSSRFAGGVELETSAPFDNYGHNLVGVSLSGPIWTKPVVDTTRNINSKKTILGFFLAGQYSRAKDPSPFAGGVYKVKDDVLNQLRERPLYRNAGDMTFSPAANNLRKSDLEKISARENVAGNRYVLNTSFDFQPKENLMFTVGGQMNYYDRNSYSSSYSLMNFQNNQQIITEDYNAYARFVQNFKDSEGSSLKNAYYQVQFDYAKVMQTTQNEKYKDNIARYPYIGKIQSNSHANYRRLDRFRTADGTVHENVYVDYGDVVGGLTFTPSGDNPYLANYTNQVLNELGGEGYTISNPFELYALGGVINGYSPISQSVYSMFSNVGIAPGSYSKLNNDQYRLSALGSATLGNHEFKLGFEFEQRIQTNFGASGSAMWVRARDLVNRHITTGAVDSLNYRFERLDGDTVRITFDPIVNPNQESVFSRNLRNKLGISQGQVINIDEISPDDLSLSLFSADELISQQYVSYQGYTYDGKRRTKKVSFNDYFSDLANRPQDALRPVYAAAFIQDKFEIDDLIINLGVRVDRYDANQRVLKDKYSLVDVSRVGDFTANDPQLRNFANSNGKPANIGDDYVIYVNRDPGGTGGFTGANTGDFEIVGYRKDEVFYTKTGERTDDIMQLQQEGNIYPLFNVNAQGEVGTEYLTDRKLSVNAFRDYNPQITVMPRLAFSFPISEDALFFAHYDILTQRPENNATRPSDYYFLLGSVSGNSNNNINNPDLKPQKRIDYQVGFQQRLSKSSGLTISASYVEYRDQIQFRRIVGAYPTDYNTFGNLDFGTVKNMTLEYDLRRTRNFSMSASYTLQFAKGTGSSSTSSFNLISQGQPNLRTPIPLDFDQRHQFKTNFDFRFAKDEGPVLFDYKIFENAGLNLQLYAGSGTPYSSQANPTPDMMGGVASRSTLEGALNGSRLPGNFRAALRIDKDFIFKQDGFIKTLNVYFRVQNLFNNKNIINVYRYTGSANDDGYLASDLFKASQFATNQSYIDLYQTALFNISNGANYTLPRRAYLGCTFTF